MVPTVTLPTGAQIPQLGFGTYKIAPSEAEQAVATALEAGYRHVDTAAMYGNEAEVGRAIAAAGLPRDELFVTTKLNNPDSTPTSVRPAFERSLDLLGLERVDLYLMHWPLARSTDMVGRWQAMVTLLETGRVSAVGVSNFTDEHLRTVIAATGVVPVVNQVEINPYLSQEPLRQLHRELGIVTQAWSPLARARVLTDPAVERLALEYGHTPSQIVLRWHIQRGDVTFPKSTNPERIASNLDVFGFELDNAGMAAIDALNRDERSGSAPDSVELDDARG